MTFPKTLAISELKSLDKIDLKEVEPIISTKEESISLLSVSEIEGNTDLSHTTCPIIDQSVGNDNKEFCRNPSDSEEDNLINHSVVIKRRRSERFSVRQRCSPSPIQDDTLEVAISGSEEDSNVALRRQNKTKRDIIETLQATENHLNIKQIHPLKKRKIETGRRQPPRRCRKNSFSEEDNNDSEEEEDEELNNESDEEDEEEEEDNVQSFNQMTGRIEKVFACRWRTNNVIKNENTTKDLLNETQYHIKDNDLSLNLNNSQSMTSDFIDDPSMMTNNHVPISTKKTSQSNKQQTLFKHGIQEMEYYVKFEGLSYRRLQWLTRTELSNQKNDQGDLKILHFHRKLSPGEFNKEIPLTPQDQGNFLLYNQVDRIIHVRKNEADGKRQHLSNKIFGKEYLVKWKLLGYGESTWEDETALTNAKDLEAIQRFIEINASFEFPVCAPSPGMTMASDLLLLDENQLSLVLEYHQESRQESLRLGMIPGERYQTDAVTRQEGATRLWHMFLKRKLGSDGTYIPSIKRRQKCLHHDIHNQDILHKSQKHVIESVNDNIISSRSLMAHQQEGLKWLFFNTEINRHGSLLADEMGLGKTCQSIAFLEHFLDVMSAGTNSGCHGLVVVQKSVFENWRREFDIWAPHLNVLPLCGGRKDRELVKKYEHKWVCPNTGKPVHPPSGTHCRKLMKPDVVLVTYEGLRTLEFQQLTQGLGSKHFKWSCVIVDECQKVKGGRTSVLLQLLSQLKRDLMILLTGTPIQNTTEELFPMLTLLHPTTFYYDEFKDHRLSGSKTNSWNATRFNSTFSCIQDRENCMQLTEELHQLMAPYILRREKSHVLKTLPPKTVKLIKIPLTLVQKRVYSALYHRSIRTKGLKFSNIHMQLRKCCIHPYLIEGMEELIFEGKIIPGVDDRPTSIVSDSAVNSHQPSILQKTTELSHYSDVDECLEKKTQRLFLESSGKFILLKKMLESFKDAGRKVLLFSFFKTALDLIEDFITTYKFQWVIERVDGQTTGEERQLAIDRFNADPQRFLFLCTTRAGGLGINLTAASVVIHLDSDFNPQHDLQAQARCHRIGQAKNVDVFHFIAEHTYEDYMLFTIAGKKLGLEAVLLGRLDATKGKMKLDKQQEEKVLRKGVFAAIRDDEAAGKEAAEFAQSSIDTILSTKATTVTFEAGNMIPQHDESKILENQGEDMQIDNAQQHIDSRQGTLFSAATFTISSQHNKHLSEQVFSTEGLEEDRPDFWIKVAQRLGPWTLEEDKPQELTRADRRRGRNVSYRASYYDEDDYNSLRRNTLPRSIRYTADITEDSENKTSGSFVETGGSGPDDEDSGLHRRNGKDDEIFCPQTNSEDNSESDDSEETTILKDDLEIGGNIVTSHTGTSASTTKKLLNHSLTTGRQSNRQRSTKIRTENDGFERLGTPGKQKDTGGQHLQNDNYPSPQLMNWVEWSKIDQSQTTISSLNHTQHQFGNTTPSTSFGLPAGPAGSILAMDLLYRCLRALKRWRNTRVGETGGLRTDDIRDADRCSPWALGQSNRRPLSAADQLLRQSWLETLQEWRKAGDDWECKKSAVVDFHARKVLQSKRDCMESQWLQHMRSLQLTHIKSKEQLIQQMNTFFVMEARRLAMSLHGDIIVKELQALCDEGATEVLTGRHFSREFTIKKQTWIGAEDFCIKLVFIHLMARRYTPPNIPPPTFFIMRWPPPQLEINWAVTTEVIKRLNQYTGGPERRRAAIHERFYNKLDSRWNHDDFIQEERDILSIATANGLAAHIVAEEMPGRSLERVKKGLKCPSVLREAQREDLLIQQPITSFSNVTTTPSSGIVVDVISRFRNICREKGLSAKEEDDVSCIQTVSDKSTASVSHSTSPSHSELLVSTPRHISNSIGVTGRFPFASSKPAQLPPVVVSASPEPLPSSINDILEGIKVVLTKIGVSPNDFEGLRCSLRSQPASRLLDLLQQLQGVYKKHSQLETQTISSTPNSLLPSPQPHMSQQTGAIAQSVPSEEAQTLSKLKRLKQNRQSQQTTDLPCPTTMPLSQSVAVSKPSSLTAAASALSASLKAVRTIDSSTSVSEVCDVDADDSDQRDSGNDLNVKFLTKDKSVKSVPSNLLSGGNHNGFNDSTIEGNSIMKESIYKQQQLDLKKDHVVLTSRSQSQNVLNPNRSLISPVAQSAAPAVARSAPVDPDTEKTFWDSTGLGTTSPSLNAESTVGTVQQSIAEIHRRMRTDSAFATKVVEYIERLQRSTSEETCL